MRDLLEGLKYLEMKGMVNPVITIDEYAASMGTDDDIITVTFKVKSQLVAQDLEGWFEKGYKSVLDAAVSEGEVSDNIYLVFVEFERRYAFPEQLAEIVSELETLTGIKLGMWKCEVNGKTFDFSIDSIEQNVILVPKDYREKFNMNHTPSDIQQMKDIATL